MCALDAPNMDHEDAMRRAEWQAHLSSEFENIDAGLKFVSDGSHGTYSPLSAKWASGPRVIIQYGDALYWDGARYIRDSQEE